MRFKNTTDFSSSISKILNAEYESRKHNGKNKTPYSQKNFADDIGIDKTLLNHYMQGDRVPTLENIFKIHKELNCSVDYLLGLSKNRSIDISDEESLISEMSKYTGLDNKAIVYLHDCIPEEMIDSINALLNSGFTFELLFKIHNYFTNESESSFVLPFSSFNNLKKDKMTFQVEPTDLFENNDGKMYISEERHEALRLENIGDTIKKIKEFSNYHLDFLLAQQKTIKKEIRKYDTDKETKEAAIVLKEELSKIAAEIKRITEFNRKETKNGKK